MRIEFSVFAATVLLSIPALPPQAAEVDFSCMSHRVWSKDHVSSQFMDNDIVLQNECPGAVYWSMCIERMDPWTNRILETHNPTGYVEAGKKARVNLHLQKSKNRVQFRNRFQEYYVSFGYGIEAPVPAVCVAKRCESQKRELREQIRTNEKAWESAENALTARIKNDCPDTGWNGTTGAECETQIRNATGSEMRVFPQLDRQLREQLAAIDPENCQVWAGELTGG